MKRKILSIALALGMMLSLFSITPASAADAVDADSLPYFFKDFEDSVSIFNQSNVSVVDGGIGGSGKALKISETNTDTCKDYHIRNSSGSYLSGTFPAGSTVKISFWVKLSTPLRQCDFSIISYDIAGKIGYPKGTGDKNSTEWQKIEFEFTTTSDATFSNMMFRTGNTGNTCNSVIGGTTAAPGDRSYLIDEFEIAVYKKGLKKTEQLANFDDYYAGYEGDVAPFALYGNKSGRGVGYWNATTTNMVDGTKSIQIVSNPSGEGKVVRYSMGGTITFNDTNMMITDNLSTSQYDGRYQPEGTIPNGVTATIKFKYYLAQAVSSEGNPGFSISANGSGGSVVFTMGDFATTANTWHTAVLTYTNNTGADVTLASNSTMWLRPCRDYQTGSGVIKAATITSGTYGDRTIYFDDMEMSIVAPGVVETPDAVAPITANLQILDGEFAEGNTVSFAQLFMSGDGVATDASIVKLVNEDASGKKGTLAHTDIYGTMTVPELPDGGTISFEVLPIDSSGVVGEPVSYTYAQVVGFSAELELSDFAGDGSVTAKVNMENMKHDYSDVNAVLVVLMYDAQGGLVKYEMKQIVCPYNTVISGETAAGKLVVTTDSATQSEVATAEAYLWDCGTESTPSHTNTTMKELVPDCSVAK